ncbi:MAG TPA: serine hydrolase domain-containing protein [Stackebrandtia sp.]|jgi:CubicO group peptidase (beta-lactamase class C family)|uniref:serine hydrolase domain-containing protein n=1 Tax=Stackebrandtia sp. TaxID=2023065 RepID=UPI002D411A22|nr:serine hydrolase domain-containing protein [Stackebrandtia sp.]HZE41270.1 serine hydrolase domain-containing protein [Stackebrandtia sp.]
MRRILVALAAAGLVLAPGIANAAPTAKVDARSIDALVNRFLDDSGVPGATVVVTKADKVIRAHGYGVDSNGDRLSASTGMPIASVSKSFTATAVSHLVDDGKVDLDKPVREYVHEFSMDDPRAKRITVRQLLNQTSGMADGGFAEKEEEQPSTLHGAVTRLADAGLVAAPGKSWNYHNPNFQVAARLVEEVSGKPFGAYLRDEIFGPLGMNDTRAVNLTDNAQVPKGFASAYGYRSIAEPHRFVGGSDGIVTTASDMGKWLRANATGDTDVLTKTDLTRLHTTSKTNPRYGLGWEVDRDHGHTVASHSGVWFSYTARQTIDTDTGWGVAVMANAGMSLSFDAPYELSQGLLALTRGEQPAPNTSAQSTSDLVVGALTILTVAWGVWRLARVRRWVERRTHRPLWRNALALTRSLFPVLILALYPEIGKLIAGGRTATWLEYLYTWFSVVGWLLVAALFGLAITATRAIRLRLSR